MPNPFFYGNPVPPDQLVDRRREIRRIVGRIVNQGQSTAIVGEPRSGKTSLLLYLSAPEKQMELYGSEAEHIIFSYLDAQTLGQQFGQEQFWKLALQPFYDVVIAPKPDSALAQAYETCKKNEFGTFVLERLFAQMNQANYRLVLMPDEFDSLLYHPVLNSAEFFGSLRSLVSRLRAVALIPASRQSLAALNKNTSEFSRTGSPYFNFLDEITLGPLPDRDVAELLRQAQDRFNTDDRRFILGAAGGHPYFVQAAASELWDAYHEIEDNAEKRRQVAGHNLYKDAELVLDDTWRLWSPTMRKAFIAVALDYLPTLLPECEFHVTRLTRDLRDLEPELRVLEKQGYVEEDESIPGGWRVRAGVFLWWLADELVKIVRRDTPFEEWLQAQEMEGLLTKGEKQRLEKAARSVGELLKGGATALIQAAAKGLGEALVKTK
jgi:hypothetical protein